MRKEDSKAEKQGRKGWQDEVEKDTKLKTKPQRCIVQLNVPDDFLRSDKREEEGGNGKARQVQEEERVGKTKQRKRHHRLLMPQRQ